MSNLNIVKSGSKCTASDLLTASSSNSSQFIDYDTEVVATDVREQKEIFGGNLANTSLFERALVVPESSQEHAKEEFLQTGSVTTEVEELKQQIKELKEEHAVEIEQLKKLFAEEYQLNLREFMRVLQELGIVKPASSPEDLAARLLGAPDYVREMFFQYVKF